MRNLMKLHWFLIGCVLLTSVAFAADPPKKTAVTADAKTPEKAEGIQWLSYDKGMAKAKLPKAWGEEEAFRQKQYHEPHQH